MSHMPYQSLYSPFIPYIMHIDGLCSPTEAIQKDAVPADLRAKFGEEFLNSNGFRAAAQLPLVELTHRELGFRVYASRV